MRLTHYTTGMLIVCAAFLLAASVGHAADVVLLEPSLYGNTGGGQAAQQSFADYINTIFLITIGVASALAVVQITVGGIERMTKDSIQGQRDGNERIVSAVGGLVLLLASVIILQTINPQLLNFDLENLIRRGAETVDTGGSGGGGGVVDPDELAVRQYLRDNGVGVNNVACEHAAQTNCTNVSDLPQSAIDSVVALHEACNCSVVITGGAEAGHQTHGPGRAIYDLRPTPSLVSYIEANGGEPRQTDLGPAYTINSVEYVHEVNVQHPHFHACVGGC